LRQLEYGQRLVRRARNVMTLAPGESTGRRLYSSALAAGAQALQRPVGALAVGARADIVLLDDEHPDLAARHGDHWLDAWIFVAGRNAVKTVLAGGERVVDAGRHIAHAAIAARFKSVIAQLAAT
jgi:cytosine/adenosine deaminase-related metal-dependent hydrolase